LSPSSLSTRPPADLIRAPALAAGWLLLALASGAALATGEQGLERGHTLVGGPDGASNGRPEISLRGARTRSLDAGGPRLMTWNIDGGEASSATIGARIERAFAAVGPVDVLVLQEIVEQGQVEAAAAAGEFSHWALSDFSPPVAITKAWHKSLEVAVLSRLPITSVAEWDTTGPLPEGDRYPPRTSAAGIPSISLRLAIDAGNPPPSRGFLRVDLVNGWSVYAVHWKSSRGRDCTRRDRANARLREVQAAGLAADAEETLGRGRTVIVAGDFNIQAPGRVLRVGRDPDDDCAPTDGSCEAVCGERGRGWKRWGSRVRDGYDDSIALLLRMDPSARLLSGSLDSTYVLRRFPGGAIDHILVADKRGADRGVADAGANTGHIEATGFSLAVTPPLDGKGADGGRWHGSDHRPVLIQGPPAAPAGRQGAPD